MDATFTENPVVIAPYLEGLNPEQEEAVCHMDGPLLVLSGAGTGKTSVLTRRIVHLLQMKKTQLVNILAVTFTNKAALEMLHRVQKMLNTQARIPWLGTFHAIGAKLLRLHAREALNLTADFTILSPDDQLRLLKQLIIAQNIDIKRWPVSMLAAFIDQWKNQGVLPDDVPESASVKFAGRGRHMYQIYQARLRELNVADFGDLLLAPLQLLRRDETLRHMYQDQFHYVLVDEYQDTNAVQYQLLRLLAQKNQNICCVGDDDQSIYSWRGSSVDHILRFEADFPSAKTIRLERNYRSLPPILASASHLIAHNTRRLKKQLWTDQHTHSNMLSHVVNVMQYQDNDDEANGVAQYIMRANQNGVAMQAIAILVRTGFQMRAFEEQFMKQSIPYIVVGGPRFYERTEIADINAYLRLTFNHDDDLAFERIINKPKRGLGEAVLRTLRAHAQNNGFSLMRAARTLTAMPNDLRPAAHRGLEQFVHMIDVWTNLANMRTHLIDLCRKVLEDTGYVTMLKQSQLAEDHARIENVYELQRSLGQFATPIEYLEHIALISDIEQFQANDCVKIMTLHSAKGLEFDLVFLPGWEEGIFPHQRVLDEQGSQGLEEERRLAYVGITRARRKVMISFAKRRCIYSNWQTSTPSRFLGELPTEHITTAVSKRAATASSYTHTSQAASFTRRNMTPISLTESESVVQQATPSATFYPGQKVTHAAFGAGYVDEVDGDKLKVTFKARGTVRLLATYVTPSS